MAMGHPLVRHDDTQLLDERHDFTPPDDVNWQDWYAGLALCDYFELPPVLDVDMSPQERARQIELARQIDDLCGRGEKAVLP